ncbi:MAG: hypothetical protein ACTSYS_09565 [Promethearchaeota archaeon]
MTSKIATALSKMLSWFDSIENEYGYTGPVTHWWSTCMHYSGNGYDWRYEVTLDSFLELYKKTGEKRFLNKLLHLLNVLENAQTRTGNFQSSFFEGNPKTNGTPHEATIDKSLLKLAIFLKATGNSNWIRAYKVAEKNLSLLLLRLRSPSGGFYDQESNRIFVSNKIASLCEALVFWHELMPEKKILDKFVMPALPFILKNQIQEKNHPGRFGIVHTGTREKKIAFTYYSSRCVPLFLRIHEITGDPTYLEIVKNITSFLRRMQKRNGGFFTGIDFKGNIIRYPEFIGGSADIIMANHLLGFDVQKNIDYLLKFQLESGGFYSFFGLNHQYALKEPHNFKIEARDLLPVSFWTGEVLRLFAYLLPKDEPLPEISIHPWSKECIYYGKNARFHEDNAKIYIINGKKVYFYWKKKSQFSFLKVN